MNHTEIEQISEGLYFVAASPASRRLRTQAELLSQTDVPLLITGEPGSGKATVAHMIHALSIRSSFPFAIVNCSTLTADLLESELFGVENARGGGATEPKTGKFDQCAKGTVLLRDLDAMPVPVQLRLLKLLQTREFMRFGGQSPVRADVRVIATARGNLKQAVAEGRLSGDLYYLLSVFELNIPPLRERREEIPLLLGHFMNRLSRRYGVPAHSYSNSLLEACQNNFWPGNLHQLEIFVKRFLVLGDEGAALAELESRLPSDNVREMRHGVGNGQHKENGHAVDEKSSLKTLVRNAKGEAERSAIVHALEETHWNRKAAARALSISYRSLLYKIEEYRLIPEGSLSKNGHRSPVGNEG